MVGSESIRYPTQWTEEPWPERQKDIHRLLPTLSPVKGGPSNYLTLFGTIIHLAPAEICLSASAVGVVAANIAAVRAALLIDIALLVCCFVPTTVCLAADSNALAGLDAGKFIGATFVYRVYGVGASTRSCAAVDFSRVPNDLAVLRRPAK